MKLYQDYKKLFRNTRQDLVHVQGLALLILLILLLFPVTLSYAETALEIQNKISQKDSDIQKLEQEITAYQIQLDDLSQQKTSLNSSLKQLDITKKKLNADIAVTQNKIDKTNLTIQNLSSDIDNKQDYINNDIDAISLGIKQMNETEQGGILQTLLSLNDFTVVWNDIDNIVSVREKVRENIINLKQVKSELENTRQQTINAKNQLTKLKSQLGDQQKIVLQNTNEKNKLLAQTKNSETNYQKILKDRLVQKDALEKELRDYESQLKYILDPSKLPSAGVFSWPLDYVLITQQFGKTVDSKKLYVSGSHGGVDFRAPIGTSVKSMASGIVKGTGDTDTQCPGASFGKFVFIVYDNGLSSAYGHLSLIKANVGDRVSTGQVVAYSGNTGYSTGPHLHVSVFAPNAAEVKGLPSKACPGKVLIQPIAAINAYLDPLYYLPPTTPNMFK